jgi:hypothetical protein
VGAVAGLPGWGWCGLKKAQRGRFGNYVPPVLGALGLAEVEHSWQQPDARRLILRVNGGDPKQRSVCTVVKGSAFENGDSRVNSAEVLADGFGRVREVVEETLDGLTASQLVLRLDGEANTIAWLIWHLARVQDDHVAHVAGIEQVWTSGGWFARFGLPFDRGAIGYGHSSDEVADVQVESVQLLQGYYDAVHQQTIKYVGQLKDADLDEIVDDRWDPPVTRGVRLISVISDDLQHAGQAAFIRGCAMRR